MATDKPAPTPEEVEALIARLESADADFWKARGSDDDVPDQAGLRDVAYHDGQLFGFAAAFLRRLAATVPQAVAVPREPTAAMEIAGWEIIRHYRDDDSAPNAKQVWYAMYDAALQEKP